MKFSKQTAAVALVLCFFFFSGRNAFGQSKTWDPGKTWVFMVGLLEWEDEETFASFPKENRRDVIFLNLLKSRGVPPGQVSYLQDRGATTERIQTEFIKLLSRTRAGDTILVYYEGHGYKTDDDKTYFASYDVDDENNPGWEMSSVPVTIEKHFRGSTAIIALDNCYSGTMANIVKTGKRRVSYAVLASSSASQMSTANWTFTEAVISAFRGDAISDDNKDGIVTFAELQANAEADMLFGDEQVASFAFTNGFDPNTKISDAEEVVSPRIGERIEAYSIDDWYKGFIAEAKNDKFRVHYYGYESSDDEWVTAKMIRVPKITSRFRVGEKVEVEWKKQWYPAHVLNIKGGSHYVSYDDYDTDENEWVSSKRIRKIE